MKRKCTVVIKKHGRWFVAYIREIPGVNTQGRTRAEVRCNLKEALTLISAVNSKKLPAEPAASGRRISLNTLETKLGYEHSSQPKFTVRLRTFLSHSRNKLKRLSRGLSIYGEISPIEGEHCPDALALSQIYQHCISELWTQAPVARQKLDHCTRFFTRHRQNMQESAHHHFQEVFDGLRLAP
jgi:predicted RNase H-like HicB family nuclease